MPPSPAMRCSPGREPRADNHKRGRSLESGILFKERDDDLALFNEVQSQEKDNFLLQSNDDFEDTFTTKLRHFSDYKHGLQIPARGESSDLLNAEEEKNDYEWLITPPDTPLFPSLDDDAPLTNVVQRGRSRTQPISISRSSTMEKSHRSSRGSASPNRLSTSPRSNSTTIQTSGRASSALSSSPPATLRPATASRRPSPPSSKPSTPLPRASTPNSRRLSTGSTNTSGVRGISPVKTSRGNSTSPKVRAWRSNIPGFSNEAPPNLRTSLADRPASYVRGSSPASRNSRQSMSPTPSRSISSSHSHHSKGSIASSAEDDAESLPPITVGSSERPLSRKMGGFPNNKASVSKKPSRIVSSSSAPKRSFDLALRQMEQRKGPQNMFRPLLSSVPSSTFYAGKSTTTHRTIISRNSSMTTSSNASSDLGTSGAHDIEATELNHDEATSECVKVPNHDVDDEIFVFEKTEVSNEASPIVNHGDFDEDLNEFENLGDTENPLGFDESNQRADFLDISKEMLLCSRCSCRYSHVGSTEEDVNLCETCRKSTYSPLTISEPQTEATMSGKDNESLKMVEPQTTVIESQDLTLQPEDLAKNGQSTYAEPIWNFLSENSLPRQQSEDQEPPKVNDQVKIPHGIEPIQHNVDFPKSKVETLEGAGISILLKRSSSIKSPLVRSRNFSASSISYDDLSYVRGSVSASSSVDFGPAKHTDTRFQRQSSSRKSDTENYKFDPNAKHQRSGSSLSGTSSHAFHPPSIGTSTLENEDVTVTEDIENEDDNNFQTKIVSTFDLSAQSQSAVNSGETLLMESSKYEEPVSFQKFEDLGNDTSALRTCTVEEDASTDAVEVPLNAISGDFDHICSSPASQCDDVSQSSKSSIEELQDPAVPSGLNKEIAVSAMDADTSNQSSSFLADESLVLVRSEGGINGRSLTLEEATETILFCSSIVHNLAYEAATIAVDNQNPQHPLANTASWPLIPAIKKSENSDKNELQIRNTSKRPLKSPKNKPKKAAETDTTTGAHATAGEKPDLRKPRIVFPNSEENTKPPKLESKCNCTIM